MEGHRLEFRESENPWAPTAVVAEINARTGSELALVGLSEQTGGTSSAAYVRWPDGRDGALTRTATPLDRMCQTAEVMAMVRARGIPVPRHDLVLELADGRVAVVQERLPGRHASRIGRTAVDAMVAMNDRFAGLLVDRSDVPLPPAFLTPRHEDHDHPWHETLGRYSERSRRVLRRFFELGGGGNASRMTGDDVVHTDYSFGNVLFDEDGQISGVVDWNFGVNRGDCRYALLGMRGHLANEGDQYEGCQDAIDRLDEVLETTIEPSLLRAYWVHRTVQGVHWAIHDHLRPDRIDHDLDVAESHLD